MKSTTRHLFTSLVICTALLFVSHGVSLAQQTKKAAAFHGAQPTRAHYKTIYQLDTSDNATINKTLRNIANVMKDPRLKGKLTVELVAFAGGVKAFLKGSSFEKQLKELSDNGVILAQCNNTLHERHISPDKLYPFISIVPSGNGELIIRQQQGWAIVHP